MQRGPGRFFSMDYNPGSFLDHLVETYAGPHDFLNSPVFYDNFGNNIGRSSLFNALNAGNVVLATPFAIASIVPTYAYGALGD
jgi:filamentous hemagglutinin